MKQIKFWLKIGIYIFIFYCIILQLCYLYVWYIIQNNNNIEGFDESSYINKYRNDFYTEAEAVGVNILISVEIALATASLAIALASIIGGIVTSGILVARIYRLQRKFVKENYPKTFFFSGILFLARLTLENN